MCIVCIAVSYTHLDGYKRQNVHRCMYILLNGGNNNDNKCGATVIFSMNYLIAFRYRKTPANFINFLTAGYTQFDNSPSQIRTQYSQFTAT